MHGISIAGTAEIREFQLPLQGSFLNSTEVIFHSMNEKIYLLN